MGSVSWCGLADGRAVRSFGLLPTRRRRAGARTDTGATRLTIDAERGGAITGATTGAAAELADATARLAALAERRREAIRAAFTRLHPLALGCGLGVTAGLGVFAAAFLLVVRGVVAHDKQVGLNLRSLASYFPGFTVDLPGAFVGGLYGFAAGFLAGYAIAAFRNVALRLVLGYARWSADRFRRRHLLDEI